MTSNAVLAERIKSERRERLALDRLMVEKFASAKLAIDLARTESKAEAAQNRWIVTTAIAILVLVAGVMVWRAG